jgi:hypothetical protein
VPYRHHAQQIEQIEIRMTDEGRVEIFALNKQEITVKSFDEWKEIN